MKILKEKIYLQNYLPCKEIILWFRKVCLTVDVITGFSKELTRRLEEKEEDEEERRMLDSIRKCFGYCASHILVQPNFR